MRRPTDLDPPRLSARRVALAIVLLGLTLLLLAPQLSAAQDVDPAAEAARAEFNRGVTALRAERIEVAVDALERSLELRDGVGTRYNLAVALSRAGRFADAIEHLEHVLSARASELTPSQVEDARERMRNLRSQLVTLNVEIPNLAGVQVRMNDELLSIDGLDSGTPFVARVDPGAYRFEVLRQREIISRSSVDGQPGDELTVRFRLPQRYVQEQRAQEPGAPIDEGGGISPWIWVVLGAVVVGAGVGAAVLLLDESAPDVAATVSVLRP